MAIIETPEETVAEARREAEARKHDAEDLDAQIRAADAAEDQIFPAWLAAILSSAGTALIVWTLIETRKGNAIAKREYGRARVEAKNSAADTARALKIAEDNAAEAAAANKIARETQAADLRPYVYVDRCGMGVGKTEALEIQAEVRNFGRTPAARFALAFNWGTREFPYAGKLDIPVPAFEYFGEIGPGAFSLLSVEVDPPIPFHVARTIEEGNAALFVVFEWKYEDGFGNEHSHREVRASVGKSYPVGSFHIHDENKAE